ncbi:hypothetical protein [Deinococcus fonticola]|uniref:hypothetical protein n=1 Tax=Deinococcus fonticola TaxID=2528713 RepID=UPI001074C02F|nr:hypothetical protein [Deinococcus fonticola]
MSSTRLTRPASALPTLRVPHRFGAQRAAQSGDTDFPALVDKDPSTGSSEAGLTVTPAAYLNANDTLSGKFSSSPARS